MSNEKEQKMPITCDLEFIALWDVYENCASVDYEEAKARLFSCINHLAAAQPERAKPTAIALTDADIDAHLSAVLRASGSSLRNYSNALMLSNMRAAMIAAMSHLTAPIGESDKTVGSDHG